MLKGIVIGPISFSFLWDDPVIEYAVRLGPVTVTLTQGKTLKMQFTLPDDSQIGFVLPTTGKDAKGNLVTLKTPPTIAVSDTTILTLVQPDPATPNDPNSGVIVAAGALGTAQVTITDADESTNPLVCLVGFTVVAGELVALSDPTFGPIVQQPVPPPPAPAS